MRRSPAFLLLLLAACAGEVPTSESSLSLAAAHSDDAREAVARRVARALADSAFRAEVAAALAASPHPEGKVHLGRFLRADQGRAAGALQRHGASPAELARADELELYFPVPAHRAGWNGGAGLLVGTVGDDEDEPVAFDLHGRPQGLRRDAPPAIPVLAVVPMETDFDSHRGRVSAAQACQTCDPDGGGSVAGLYLTASHMNESFESWLKGQPEFEVLVLGQKGTTDSLTSYQCAGNFAPAPYYFDQNALDWSGSALLMTQAQLDGYSAVHPGQAVRLFFMEDDDTPCQIRANSNDLRALLATVDSVVKGFSGGLDQMTTGGNVFRYLRAAQKLVAVAASLIKSNDDLIGNAVEDVTTAERYPGYNWIVKGASGRTNGYVKLEMR
ncbi:MAG TPA: hypothetical protein VF037_00685 [Gemmatimonadales bacterium]